MMNKIIGLCCLAVINSTVFYLIYWYLAIACSTNVDNSLHVAYEPSGMQLFYYFISLPAFIILALLSIAHSYYFNLKDSLASAIIIIWCAYFSLILYIDLVVHFPAGNKLLYYGSWIISLIALGYITYLTYRQCCQLKTLPPDHS